MIAPRARRRFVLALLLLAACASEPPLPAPPRTHPASPEADEAAEVAPNTTLVMPERQPPQGNGKSGRGH